MNLNVPSELLMQRPAVCWVHPAGASKTSNSTLPNTSGWMMIWLQSFSLSVRVIDQRHLSKDWRLRKTKKQPVLEYYQKRGVLEIIFRTETNTIWPHTHAFLQTKFPQIHQEHQLPMRGKKMLAITKMRISTFFHLEVCRSKTPLCMNSLKIILVSFLQSLFT